MKHIIRSLFALTLLIALCSVGSFALTVLDSCDALTVNEFANWTGNYAEVCEDDAPEGTGYITGSVVNGSLVLYRAFDDPLDISEYADGYFILKIYVDDLSSISDGVIEMFTGEQISSWDLLANLSEDGWNDVAVKISEGAIFDGGLDVSNFTAVRLVAHTANADNILGCDDLGIGMKADAYDFQIENCDALSAASDFTGNSWAATGSIRDDLDEEGTEPGVVYRMEGEEITPYDEEAPAFMEGHGSIYRRSKDTAVLCFNMTEPVDLSGYDVDDCYLMFWLYMSDGYGTSLGGQVELTSSGSADVEEITWSATELLPFMTDGWAPVYLPLNGATGWMDTVDLSAIDYFRVYDFVTAGEEIEMRIDQVCIGTYEEGVELGFITPIEDEEETVEEAEETEEVPAEKATEGEAEEPAEPAETEGAAGDNAAAAASEEESKGLSTGALIGIIAAAAVVIAALIAGITVSKKKKSA